MDTGTDAVSERPPEEYEALIARRPRGLGMAFGEGELIDLLRDVPLSAAVARALKDDTGIRGEEP